MASYLIGWILIYICIITTMGKQRQNRLRRNRVVARLRNNQRLARQSLGYTPNLEFELLSGPIPDSKRTFLKAPSNFSLRSNRENVIEFFQKASRHAERKIPTIFDMSSIEFTDMPTICLLMSIMMDMRAVSQNFRRYTKIRYPTGDHPAAKFFEKVQFEKTVMGNKGIADHNLFLSRTSTKDNKGYKKYILDQSQLFFGEGADISGLNSVLTEIITNTHNHADPNREEDEENKIPWFAAWMPVEEEGKICYTIVDLGVGIAESWKSTGIEQRKRGLLPKVLFDAFFKDTQGGMMRKRIPQGVESSTRLLYRGQGLKEIYDQANGGPYSVFSLYTNRAEVNLLNMDENIPDSKYNLVGTIFYWELQIEQ